MIRNETFIDDVCVSADIVDPDTMRVQIEQDGVIVGSRPATTADLGASAVTAARAAVLSRFATLGITEEQAVLAGLIPPS